MTAYENSFGESAREMITKHTRIDESEHMRGDNWVRENWWERTRIAESAREWTRRGTGIRTGIEGEWECLRSQ